MGYRIYCDSGKSKFVIRADRAKDAVDALMAAEGPRGKVRAAVKNIRHFDALPPVVQLTEIVNDVWGFVLKVAGKDSIDGLYYGWEKGSGEEDEVFKLLAPYVDAGCFVQMRGEEGEQWRYVFDGVCMRVQRPVITWVYEDAK